MTIDNRDNDDNMKSSVVIYKNHFLHQFVQCFVLIIRPLRFPYSH